MTSQTPQPESVDYTGALLAVGQSVTFIEENQDRRGEQRLYTGEVKMVGREQLVVESGGRLFIVQGREASHPTAYRYDTVKALD